MFSDETIFLKKGWRSDGIWTNPIFYRTFMSLIPLFFDTKALLRSQYWPRERLERLRQEKLRILFRGALRVPFWKEVFESAGIELKDTPTEMLSKLPVTTKYVLREYGLERTTDASLVKRSHQDYTSGSTGRPFRFLQYWGASLRSSAITERIFRVTGQRYPIVYMRARTRNGFTFYRHAWFFLRGYNSIRYRMEEFKKLADRFPNGFVLYGYTSWVIEVARQIERHGLSLPIRSIMVAGEHLRPADRSYIERVMGAELFTLYATREVGFLASECERHRLHLAEEWAYVEITDEKGTPLPSGTEGRVIVTTFENQVMPFIRYDVGDTGAFSDIPCECGRTSRTINVIGRTAEFIELEDNRLVPLLDITSILDMSWDGVRQFQIVQKSKSEFVFRIVSGPLFERLRPRMEARFARLLHPEVKIRWEMVETIDEGPGGKAIYYIKDFTEHIWKD